MATRFFYINGCWYDPEIMQYLSADSPENLFFNKSIEDLEYKSSGIESMLRFRELERIGGIGR